MCIIEVEGKVVKKLNLSKTNRVLDIYSTLIRGQGIRKSELAHRFSVSEKTIQRDIEDIRSYIYESEYTRLEVAYDYDTKKYFIKNGNASQRELVLAIAKILLESRAFCKLELKQMIEAITKDLEKEDKKSIEGLIGNELINYVPLEHNELLLSKLWSLSDYIREKRKVFIEYNRADGRAVDRLVKPVAIIFSEYYFYLIGYMDNYESPTVFRVDRIAEYRPLDELFVISESDRFEEGEFRKRIQFMYPGKLIKVKFEFTGLSIEAVIDRLPTSRVLKRSEGKVTLEAEVYGKGIKMWIMSQGKDIKVLEPPELVEDIKREIKDLQIKYE